MISKTSANILMERVAFIYLEDGCSCYCEILIPTFLLVQHHIPNFHSLKIHEPFQDFRSLLHLTCTETTSHSCDKHTTCQKSYSCQVQGVACVCVNYDLRCWLMLLPRVSHNIEYYSCFGHCKLSKNVKTECTISGPW